MADSSPDQPSRRRQWLLIATVAGAIIIALVAWYFLALKPNYVVLYSGMRPAQAAAIVAILEEEGVRYQLGAGGSDILVPSRDADRLRLRLESSHAATGGLEGFELFNESDMGLTDFAQRIRYQRALQGEIARTIMLIQGVADARVHVSMPERSLFRSERRSAEAAVTLVMQTGAELSPVAIEGIQRLVAAAVSDLAATDVVVLDASGPVLSSRVSIEALPGNAEAAPPPEYLIEVARLALPDRRFDVRLEEIPSALEGGEDLVEGPRRLFTITTDTLLAPEERQAVRLRFEQAGLIDETSRNLLTYRVEALPENAAHLELPVRRESSQPEPDAPSPLPLWPALAVLGALLAGLAAAWVWRRARRPALSFEQHRQLAERLSAELSQREAQDA